MDDLANVKPPAAIEAIWAATRELNFSMSSEPMTCVLLRTLVASKPSGRMLELGSGTGLSTAWLLDGMDMGSRLTAVENDTALVACIDRHLGADARLDIVCEDGEVFLARPRNERYDLIFADTWPGKFGQLDEALALLAPQGFYVVDDMLPQANWPPGHEAKVATLLSQLEALEGFAVTKLSWASGIVIAVKR